MADHQIQNITTAIRAKIYSIQLTCKPSFKSCKKRQGQSAKAQSSSTNKTKRLTHRLFLPCSISTGYTGYIIGILLYCQGGQIHPSAIESRTTNTVYTKYDTSVDEKELQLHIN